MQNLPKTYDLNMNVG